MLRVILTIIAFVLMFLATVTVLAAP